MLKSQSLSPGLTPVRALRVSRCVRERLETGARAVVRAVQRRTCHLAVEDGRLLILSTPEVPLAPNALTVRTPAPTLREAGLQVTQVVALGASALAGDADWCLAVDEASTWEPRPRVRPIRSRVLADRLEATRATVVALGTGGSLLPLLWAAEVSALPPSVVRSASLPARTLAEASLRHDSRAIVRAARGLAGLGPGQTPSGDDLLGGFAGAWALVGESLGLGGARHQRVTDAIREGAERGASPLGRAWLEHACRGELLEPMTSLVGALLAEHVGDLDAAVRGALAVGASSGTDWMVGFLLGADAVLEAGRRDRPW